MFPHLGMVALAALIPLIIGFVWYHPKFLGTAWMNACGLDEEKLKGANMPLIFGLAYLFAFMAGMLLYSIVVHQTGLYSLYQGEPGVMEAGTAANIELQTIMETMGDKFRTFGHGALHGTLTGLFLILPVMATNALFERKGAKYIAINVGYWVISFALMGGILCRFA